MSEIIIQDPVWQAIMADDRLSGARRKLSFHEIRLIIQHAQGSTPKLPDDAAVERLRAALEPFARAASLLPATELAETDWDFWVYRPAAGDKYGICGNDLRRARAALAAPEEKTNVE